MRGGKAAQLSHSTDMVQYQSLRVHQRIEYLGKRLAHHTTEVIDLCCAVRL